MDSDLLNRAIGLSKQGRKSEARIILQELVRREPASPQAWLWLADTFTDPGDRLRVLKEAARFNPNHDILRSAITNLESKQPPPPDNPPPAHRGSFNISTDELTSLDRRVSPEADHPAEADWLASLRSPDFDETEEAPTEPPASPASAFPSEPTARPVTGKESLSPDEDRAVADWLSSLELPKDEKPAFSPASSPESEPVFQPEGHPETLEELPSHPQPADEEAQEGEDIPIFDPSEILAEGGVPRRRWLGIAFIIVLLAALGAAVYLYWPTIWGSISPMVAEISIPPVVAPTTTPTITLTPSTTPTFTLTPTPTRTRTPTSTPTPTLTPIPALLKAEPVVRINIQDMKALGSVRAKGNVALDAFLLAESTDNHTVRIWDFLTGAVRTELTGPAAKIQEAAVSPDGTLAAAVSEEPAVWVWNIQSGEVLATLDFDQDFVSRYTSEGFPRDLHIQFSPDNTAVFVSSLLGMTWWDLKTQRVHPFYPMLPKEFQTFYDQVADGSAQTARTFLVSFSQDGKAIAVGSPTKVYVLTWPGAGGRATLATDKPLFSMGWMNNGFLGLSHPGEVDVWNTYTNRLLASFPGLKSQPAGQETHAAFKPDGSALAVEVENIRGLPGGMDMVGLPGGKTLFTVDPKTDNPVVNAMFSPDGLLLLGSSGGDLFVWDANTGKELRRIANRQGFSQVSPDGKYYLEITNTETIIWGVAY